MDIRPQDLPELRADLVVYHSDPRRLRKWDEMIAGGHRDWMEVVIGHRPKIGDGVMMQSHERSRIERSDLYYVAPEMTDLAVAASTSLPDFNIEPEDMPGPEGLIFFGSPIDAHLQSAGFEEGRTAGITAIAWAYIPGGDDALWLSFYASRDDVAAALPPSVAGDLVAGQRMIYLFGTEAAWELRTGDRAQPEVGSHLDIAGRVLRAAWLLMQQPLAAVQDVEPDRAAQKRLRRAGHEPASVRVIELRRPKHTGGEPGESGRSYSHRWITRGHWRQQWYPSREVHRPVWIAPHVKGPEGAPLIGGEKVYAWKR